MTLFPGRGDGDTNKNEKAASPEPQTPKSPSVSSPQYMFIPMDSSPSDTQLPKPPASHIPKGGKRPTPSVVSHRQAKVRSPETRKSIENQQHDTGSNIQGSKVV